MLEVSFEIDVCKSSMHYANFKVSFGFCFEYFIQEFSVELRLFNLDRL